MLQEIEQLEKDFAKFTQDLGRLQGEYSLLKDIQGKSEKSIEQNKEDEITYIEAVELLSVVQKVTQDKIKDSFEGIVTHALNYIYESDKYSFHLEFSRRGNLQELDFCVETPEKQEPLDLLKTDAGGTKNIVSLALRIVLMEIASPKIEGFIIADEAFTNLGANNCEKASQFLKEINQKMGRQIIAISKEPNILSMADKIIEMK